MKTRLRLLLFVSLTFACGDNTRQKVEEGLPEAVTHRASPDSVRTYVNAALDTMQKHSIRKALINWTDFRAYVLDQAEGSQTYSQAYPAIQSALKDLKDEHSFFKTSQQAAQWRNASRRNVTIDKPRKTQTVGIMKEGNIAEINIPTYASGDSIESLKFAREIQDAIRILDSKRPIGWIVNLSYNSGGNMWPMLAGIGPLLNEGVLGNFYNPDGKWIPWYYKNGEAGFGEEVQIKVPKPYVIKNKNLPIAVFISDKTASSGEAILISLRSNKHVRVFGKPSAGLSSANQSFNLKDGAQLIITTALFADKNYKIYGGKILPDTDLSKLWYYNPVFDHAIMLSSVSKWINR